MAETIADIPALLALWDADKNEQPASKVPARAYRTYWWKCKKGHAFQAREFKGDAYSTIVRDRFLVLGMSGTPVINTLQEGKSLIEMVTGHRPELHAPLPALCHPRYALETELLDTARDAQARGRLCRAPWLGRGGLLF